MADSKSLVSALRQLLGAEIDLRLKIPVRSRKDANLNHGRLSVFGQVTSEPAGVHTASPLGNSGLGALLGITPFEVGGNLFLKVSLRTFSGRINFPPR